MNSQAKTMKKFLATFTAFICASITPIFIEEAFSRSSAGIYFVVVVVLLHVLVLALPLFFLLSWLGKVNFWSVLLSGFAIGLIPFATFSWPMGKSTTASYTHWNGSAMVTSLSNGQVTSEGWREYVLNVVEVGAIGLIAALVFWLVFRSLQKTK